jgi:hypothetical protein
MHIAPSFSIPSVPQQGGNNVVSQPQLESATPAVEETVNGNDSAAPPEALTPSQQRALQQLQNRDREVRAHEAAHMAAAAGLVRGGMSFTYQNGPDGQRYAVGGEVSIDSSPVANDPQATLTKAQQIQAAALAPANPSAQDRAVAASAARMAIEARLALAQQREAQTELQGDGGSRNVLDAYRGDASVPAPSVLDQIA